MTKPQIIPLTELNTDDTSQYIRDQFHFKKSNFLIHHGEWLHKGNENRFALLLKDKMIGYFGIIPETVYWGEKQMKAIWWIDLIISKEYRGLGYQGIIDDYIRNRPELKLGFPNKWAAKIHQKHQWTVYDHLKVMMLPIIPSQSSIIKNGSSFWGPVLDFLVSPFIKVKKDISLKWSFHDKQPNIVDYVNLFESTKLNNVTVKKDSKYFKWRYLNSPFAKEYSFYLCEKPNKNRVAIIVRKILIGDGSHFRIVDMFGDLEDLEAIQDLINCVILDAIKSNAHQITIMEADKTIQKLLFKCGFILFTKGRFCYYDGNGNKTIPPTQMRWNLSDSDNDFLD